jgi:hypothetical protein
MPNSYGLLNENEVIEEVCAELKGRHFRDFKKRTTKQQGVDIKARYPDGEGELWVEAKGATSARPGSNRYHRKGGFDSSQRRDHMANAVYVCLKYLSRPDPPRGVGIAVPKEHLTVVEPVLATLQKLRVVIFLVSREGDVEVRGNLT